MSIVLRLTKGSALSYDELDGNFKNLDTRIETLESNDTTAVITSYDDLLNKPTIPNDISDLTDTEGLLSSVSAPTDYNNLINKPSIPTRTSQLTNDAGFLTTVAESDVTQHQSALSITISQITDFDIDYNDLLNKPESILDFNISDGSSGQVLTTDGNGNFSFQAGGNSVRTTADVTTSSLTPNQTETLNILGFSSYYLLSVEANATAWIRVYSSESDALADVGRNIDADPFQIEGLITEVITTQAEEVWLAPALLGYLKNPASQTIYINVTNIDPSITRTIDVQLKLIQVE